MAKIIVVFLPVIIIGLIVIALIIYAVYSSIYKKKINKKLEQNESTAHVSMVPVQTIGIIMLVMGVVVFAVFTTSMLSNLTNEISYTNVSQQKLKAELSSMSDQLTQLREQIEQQNSLFVKYECHMGDVHSDDNTVELTFSCIPKTVGDDTIITIINGDSEYHLKRNKNGEFTGTTRVHLFDTSIIVQVTTNGITNTQDITGENSEPFYKTALPVINAKIGSMHYSFSENDDKAEVAIEGSYFVMHPEGLNDYELTTYLNGEVVEVTPMTSDEHVRKTFEANNGDEIEIVAEGVDKYGYTHRHTVYQIVGEQMAPGESYFILKDNDVISAEKVR